MTVEILSPDKRMLEAKKAILSGKVDFARLYLLPIPSTKDGIHVNGSSHKLSEIDVGDGDAVVAYGLPRELYDLLSDKGAIVYDGAYDEDFLVENARLTALGVIGDVITEKNKSPNDVRFGIIGYGRIGKELLKYLYFLGAAPTVYTTKESVRKELSEVGVSARMLSDGEFTDMDVIVNTAPAAILDKESAQGLIAHGVSIFDLASGDNFGSCEGVIKLMSIPGKVYPESAGKSYGEMAIRYFSKTK